MAVERKDESKTHWIQHACLCFCSSTLFTSLSGFLYSHYSSVSLLNRLCWEPWVNVFVPQFPHIDMEGGGGKFGLSGLQGPSKLDELDGAENLVPLSWASCAALC